MNEEKNKYCIPEIKAIEDEELFLVEGGSPFSDNPGTDEGDTEGGGR